MAFGSRETATGILFLFFVSVSVFVPAFPCFQQIDVAQFTLEGEVLSGTQKKSGVTSAMCVSLFQTNFALSYTSTVA